MVDRDVVQLNEQDVETIGNISSKYDVTCCIHKLNDKNILIFSAQNIILYNPNVNTYEIVGKYEGIDSLWGQTTVNITGLLEQNKNIFSFFILGCDVNLLDLYSKICNFDLKLKTINWINIVFPLCTLPRYESYNSCLFGNFNEKLLIVSNFDVAIFNFYKLNKICSLYNNVLYRAYYILYNI